MDSFLNKDLQIGKKYKGTWVLEDDRYPRFNIWRYKIENGNSYCECFHKEVDPNFIVDISKVDVTAVHNYIKSLASSGKSITYIANIIGYSETTVRNVLNRGKRLGELDDEDEEC